MYFRIYLLFSLYRKFENFFINLLLADGGTTIRVVSSFAFLKILSQDARTNSQSAGSYPVIHVGAIPTPATLLYERNIKRKW